MDAWSRLKEKAIAMVATAHTPSRRQATRRHDLDRRQCARCGLGVETKKAKGLQGRAADPVALGCPHGLHAECLRAWHYARLTPHQRGLVDARPGARYAKSLRMLALAEHDQCFGGACERCAIRLPPPP